MAEQEISGIQIEVHSKVEDGKYQLISLSGEITTFNGEAVMARLKSLANTVAAPIMLDCEKLVSIDNMGAGIFICLDFLLKVESRSMALLKIQGQPKELLAELGYLELFCQTQDIHTPPARQATSQFPKIFECPKCSRKVKAPAPGRYLCPKCKSPITV